jgi:redox-sensitive bicupin YhaK (pirin superfamily)
LYASILQAGSELDHAVADSHKVFVQLVYGEITVNGEAMAAGDGVQISDEESVMIECQTEAEFLLFDMG